MNVPPENIIVNSCDYTPIYLIPSTSVTQAGSYIITQSNQDARKPVADNLKTYYENSGNLESGILSSPKPRILKKHSASVVGNNLKLASFLLPKSESINVASITNLTTVQPQPQPIVQAKQPIPALNNVIMKPPPPVTTVTTATNNVIDSSLPSIEIDRKIVRVGTIPTTKRTQYPRVLPKNKRFVTEQKELKELKEKIDPNLSKHTSVQLIKLGETYHSLNQLSDEQMKIVNKALKMFSDPEKIPKEPAYDPVTNTKFIYKVVSPRDLTVVGRNKNVVMKKKSEEIKEKVKKQKLIVDEPEPEEQTPVVETQPKVTRSGRTVKLPKAMRPNETPHRPKKKVGSVVNCFQCSAEFCSFYRLQRHYEQYPTHIPARIHTDLFHCLLAILKGGSEEDQANMFIQQLEQLIEKIRTVLPCVLSATTNTKQKPTTFREDIARLFGLSPGKYHLNMNGLCCVKDKEGHCVHNPPKGPKIAPKVAIPPTPHPHPHPPSADKPSHIWLNKHNEEIANEAETEDCARIHSVDKWPNVTKRIWKLKQQKQANAKKMRLISENDQPIELGTEDVTTVVACIENGANGTNGAINVATDGSLELKEEVLEIVQQEVVEEPAAAAEEPSKRPAHTAHAHAQFHSAHFDIRSSPIKLPSSLVRKFQFHPDKLSDFEVQILRPLELHTSSNENVQTEETQPSEDTETDTHMQTDTNIQSDTDTDLQNTDLQSLLRDNVQLPKDTAVNDELNFDTPKAWHTTESNDSTDDSFLKSSLLFGTGLTPVKSALESSLLHMNDKQNILFDTPSKSDDLTEANLLEIVGKPKLNGLIEPSLIHVPDKTNRLFDSNQTMTHSKEQHNGFYESSSMHVKPKCNTLIGSSVIQMKDKTFESALSHVKERSNHLFDESMLHTENKSSIDVKHDSLFDTGMSDVKDRPTSLFESSLLDMKDKDSLLGPSLLQDDNSNLFNPSISHSKHDGLLQEPLVHDNTNSMNGASLLHDKDNARNSVNIDDSTSDRVLNFLDSLGNESLGLSYPETEIRNNSVDFQLDLFSFSNS